MKIRYYLIIIMIIPVFSFADEIAYKFNNDVWITNDQFSQHVALLETTRTSITNLKWSPDGKRLGFISNLGLEVYDFDDNTVHNMGMYEEGILTDYFDFCAYDWSPDGLFIVAAKSDLNNNRRLYIIPYNSPVSAVLLTTDETIETYLPHWSPTGDKISFLNNATHQIEIVSTDGTKLIQYSGDQLRLWDWTYDGSYIILTTTISGGLCKLMAVNSSSGNDIILDDSIWSDAYGWPVVSLSANKVAYTDLHLIGGTNAYYEARITNINGATEGYGWRLGTDVEYSYYTLSPEWSTTGENCALLDWDAGRLQDPTRALVGTPGNVTEIGAVAGGSHCYWSFDDNHVLCLSQYSFPKIIDIFSQNEIISDIDFKNAKWRPHVHTSLTIKDALNNNLSNKELYLIRVTDNAPIYTEDTLGVVKTDTDGKIQLTPTP